MMRTGKVFTVAIVLAAIVVSSWEGKAFCQEVYPTKAIDIIVPRSPGGSNDLGARAMTAWLSKKWGVSVNVLNKPGGNTLPAVLEVYKARPDGYTLLADSQSSSSLLGAVIKDLPIKVLDRTFIAGTANSPGVVLVGANSPYKNLDDLAADAKKDPANFTWASLGGVGGTDLLTRLFFKAAGVDVMKTKPVMTKGGGDAAILVAGGNVKFTMASSGSAQPYLQPGAPARVLCVLADKRMSYMPSVPSAKELGWPQLIDTFWIGVSGPLKLSPQVIDAWSKAMKEMSSDKDYLDSLNKLGFNSQYRTGKELQALVSEEMQALGEIYGTTKK